MPFLREDVAILYGVVVLVAGIARKQRTWLWSGAVVTTIGVIYMLIMRAQPGIGSHIVPRYQAESLSEVLMRPLRVDVLVGLGAVLLPQLVLPPLIGWKRSWPGLLLLASFAFTSWPAQASLYYQYYAQAVPFLIAGAVGSFSLPRWRNRMHLSLFTAALTAALLGPFFYFGFGLPDRFASVILSSSARSEARSMISLIPPEATVSATEMVAPALAWREEIHPFPGPMICGNSLGYFTASTRGTDYVVYEASTAPSGPEWKRVLTDWGYTRAAEAAGIELWRQVSDDVPKGDCPSWEQQKAATSAS
jgi:hypothetical protein